MVDLKLEVGKTYKTQSGDKVRITAFNGRSFLGLFQDKQTVTLYCGNGMCQDQQIRTNNDIIEQITEDNDTALYFKLEVGKFYKTREGKTVKIISTIDSISHPYEEGFRFVAGGSGQYYTEAGLTYVDGTTNPGDIVSGGLTDTEYFNSKPRFHPSPTYTEINDGMCLIILGALSGEVFDLSALEDGTTVSVKNAVIAIKAAFAHAKKLPINDPGKIKVGETYLNKSDKEVTIIFEANEPVDAFRFKSSDGDFYDVYGRFKYNAMHLHTNHLDLIVK